MYRCQHEHGLVEFSDRFCGRGATVERLTMAISGVLLGATDDYAEIEKGNTQRKKQRGISKTTHRLHRLSSDYRRERSSLVSKRENLPNNPLKKVNQRDIDAQLQRLDERYREEKKRLTSQLSHFRGI